MILLVVSLPICSSSAFASFKNATVYGNDKFPSFTKDDNADDDLNFEVIINAPLNYSPDTDEVTAMIESTNLDTEFPFSGDMCQSRNCVQLQGQPQYGSNPYKCTCKTSWAPSDYLEVTFAYTEGSNVFHSDTIPVYPDGKPPVIMSSTELIQEDGLLYLEYELEDESCASTQCNNKCVGLKEMIISDEEEEIQTVSLEDIEDQCYVEDKIEIDYSKNGDRNFFLEVRDKFWNGPSDDDLHSKFIKIGRLNTDFMPPKISDDLEVSFEEYNLNYIGDEGFENADVSFTFAENNPELLDIELSYLSQKNTDLYQIDISSLSTDNYFYYSGSHELECYRLPDTFINKEQVKEFNCTVRGIYVEAPNNLADFPVTIEDSKGSVTSADIQKRFQSDNENPVVTYLGNQIKVESERCFYTDSVTLMAEFDESASGFGTENVYLDLSSIGYQSAQRADECIKEDIWTCYWYNRTVSSGTGTKLISLMYQSADDAGNSLEGQKQKVMVYDNTEPTINQIDILGISGLGELSFVKVGDALKIYGNFSDDSSGISKAVVNLSELYDPNYENFTAECTGPEEGDEENDVQCIWETSNSILVTEFDNIYPEFRITDGAGNVLVSKDTLVRVHEISSDTPDCYKLVIDKDHIAPIELNIAKSLVGSPYFQYVPFTLERKACGRNLEIYNMKVNCGGSLLSYSKSDSRGYKYAGFVNFVLDPSDFSDIEYGGFEDDMITIGDNGSCSLSYYVASNGYAYDTEEVEYININIPLVEMLEGVEEDIVEDIDKSVERYKGSLKTLNKVDKFLGKMRMICQLSYMLDGIIQTLDGVSLGLCLTGVGLEKAAITAAVGRVIKSIGNVIATVNDALMQIDNILSKIAIIPCALSQCSGGVIGYGDGKVTTGKDDTANSDKNIIVFPGGVLPLIRKYLGTLIGSFGDALTKKLKGADESQGKTEKQENTKEANDADESEDVQAEQSPEDLLANIQDDMEIAKSSIYAAWLGLCVPAIIYHYRYDAEMDCMRSLCYLKAVPEGFPKAECDRLYEYQKCLKDDHWISVLLQLSGIRTIFRNLINALKNPTQMVYQGIKGSLMHVCNSEKKNAATETCGIPTQWACVSYFSLQSFEESLTIIDRGKELFESVKNFGQDTGTSSDVPNYCEQLEEEIEKRKEAAN